MDAPQWVTTSGRAAELDDLLDRVRTKANKTGSAWRAFKRREGFAIYLHLRPTLGPGGIVQDSSGKEFLEELRKCLGPTAAHDRGADARSIRVLARAVLMHDTVLDDLALRWPRVTYTPVEELAEQIAEKLVSHLPIILTSAKFVDGKDSTEASMPIEAATRYEIWSTLASADRETATAFGRRLAGVRWGTWWNQW